METKSTNDLPTSVLLAIMLVVGLLIGVGVVVLVTHDFHQPVPLIDRPRPDLKPDLKPGSDSVFLWMRTNDPRYQLGLREDGMVTWNKSKRIGDTGDAPPAGKIGDTGLGATADPAK